jgi:nucleoid-associated protein YgaU
MRPTPGQIYTTKEGDTLENIATEAYGDPNQYPKIQDTNNLSFMTTATNQLPTGTSLVIPEDTDLENIRREQLAGALR